MADTEIRQTEALKPMRTRDPVPRRHAAYRIAAHCLWARQSPGQGGLAAKAGWLRRLAFVLVCVLAVAAAHLLGASSAAAAATSGSSGTVQANVNDISCSASIACTAVGDYVNSSGSFVPLVMRWNGKSWTIEHTPQPPPGESTAARRRAGQAGPHQNRHRYPIPVQRSRFRA